MKQLIELIQSTESIIQDVNNVSSRIIKGTADYATMVDIKIQEYLQEKLLELYPDYQFMGEEGAHKKLDLTKPTWILDPIDGTTNLIHGYPQCAISLGLMKEDRIVLGIVYNPFLKQLFTAELGKGAKLNGQPICVSTANTLEECLISAGTAPYHKQHSEKMFRMIHRLFMEVQDIRRSGSAALEICYTAMGVTECFFETILQPWDYAAASLILTEAGGKITDMTGIGLVFDKPCSVIATNGLVHDKLLPIILDF